MLINKFCQHCLTIEILKDSCLNVALSKTIKENMSSTLL